MTNNYGIFFTFGNLVVRLPVNPETLRTDRPGNNEEYNVIGLGDINIPRKPRLREVPLSGLFPGENSSLVLTANGFRDPEFYINLFENAMREKQVITYTPVRYREDGIAFDTSDTGFLCTVESFSTEERGGETGDFYFDMVIKEWKDYSPQKATVAADEDRSYSTTKTRKVPDGQIVVGSIVTCTGKWFYTSYAETPSGNSKSGEQYKVTRIVDSSRACPIHLATLEGKPRGWVKLNQIQVVS